MAGSPIVRLAAWLMLGLFAGGSALAEQQAPVLAVDPDEPGPSLPPVGRSLFDFLTMREKDGRTVQVVPFPFEDLLAQIEKEIGVGNSLEKVLIPLGRSLQRVAASPDFFAFPRAVVAVDRGPALRPHRSGMLLKDRLYLGYQERAATIEVISYNEAAGRFEYQVVRDYREGGAAHVYYADRPTCIGCHRNHAPIFSKPLWDETNANGAIAATLLALKGHYYGIPVARGVDIPDAFDAATDRANRFAALQRVWREGCDAMACRADALLALLQYRLAGNRHLAPDRGGPAEAFAAALAGRWDTLWPGGLAVPEGDIPDRVPLARPLDPHRPLSGADLIRLTAIDQAFEPFEPRPPHEIWRAPHQREQRRRLVEGLAGFVAGADIQRLDDVLWHRDVPTTDIKSTCEVASLDLADRREIRIDCPGMLQGYVQLQGGTVAGGALDRLQIDGQALANLKVSAGRIERSDGGWRLEVQLRERTLGLHARLPDGTAIRRLAWHWADTSPGGTATLTIADDFVLVRDAVAAMREHDPDALGAGPLRRAALMPALFAALGAQPIAWCCLDDAAMPAAALEP